MEKALRGKWRACREPWERLAWARTYWQIANGAAKGNAKEAAHALGELPDTYRAYEREPGSSKHSKLTYERAIQFGTKFKVRWEWLLLGVGEPWTTGAKAKIIKAADEAEAADPEGFEQKADAIVTLLRGGSRS